jgi:pyruvate kinase
VADQLTLEWGVHPTLTAIANNVDEMIDAALSVARDAAGVPSGATVVITAGRRTGTPGATNLIMVREVP